MGTGLKLFAMGTLCVASVILAAELGHVWQWLVCVALLFSLLGDALLARLQFFLRRMSDTFVPGMGAFAVAQIFYSIAFYQSMRGMPALHMPVPGMARGIDLLPTVLPIYILVGVLAWVWMVMRAEGAWDIRIAALVYCVLLCVMGGMACAASFTGSYLVWPLWLGGILFIISDGIIASRVFAGRWTNERTYDIAVWATYLPAQLMLLLGTSWLY